MSGLGPAVRSSSALLILLLPLTSPAQDEPVRREAPSLAPDAGPPFDVQNPLSLLQQVENVLPGRVRPMGDSRRNTGLTTTLSILILLTVLSIAPALLVMTTSFTRIVVVLALLRQAMLRTRCLSYSRSRTCCPVG